jgi:hydrid cluster protein-associated redox disulfide domain
MEPRRIRPPSADMTVAELLRAWPSLGSVFLHRRMACPGCAMAPFMTLREAAESYGVDADALLAELAAATEDQN